MEMLLCFAHPDMMTPAVHNHPFPAMNKAAPATPAAVTVLIQPIGRGTIVAISSFSV
jgi:hypothetical protein